MKSRSSADAQANCNKLQDYCHCNFIYVLCEYSVNLLFIYFNFTDIRQHNKYLMFIGPCIIVIDEE